MNLRGEGVRHGSPQTHTPRGESHPMALTIVPAGAPRTVKRTVTCIYGEKGAG